MQIGLDRVLLMPTGIPPHKEIADDPGAEVRAEMATAAAAGDGEWLEVSDLELRREGPSYAYETLEALQADGAGEMWWLMGADAALGLESWRRPERVVELAGLAIAAREGVMRADLEEVLARVGVRDGRVLAVEMPTIGVSSSAIRERVGAGRPIRHLVPDAVAEVIAERGLYGG